MPKRKSEDVIDVLTLEDEEERKVIDGAKAIMKSATFGFNYSGTITHQWFIDKAAMETNEYLKKHFDVLVDPPLFDPVAAHYEAGDDRAAERHLLTRWGVTVKKGWTPSLPKELERW